MKRVCTSVIFSLLLSLFTISASAQSLRILLKDTFVGAGQGALLGLGTMAASKDADLDPLRIGVGLGTLYGLGVGIYDVSQASSGDFYVYGTFNDAGTTSQIIFLDTFYGGITGSVVGMAFSLVGNSDIADGFLVGAGVGTWIGFGFGIVDGFFLSGYQDEFGALPTGPDHARGLLAMDLNGSSSVGFLNPTLYNVGRPSEALNGFRPQLGLDVASLRVNF